MWLTENTKFGKTHFSLERVLTWPKSRFLFGTISLYSCVDFIILVNLSGEKVDFFLARSPGLYSCIDFVILENLTGEKVDFFFARFPSLYNCCNDFVILVNLSGKK